MSNSRIKKLQNLGPKSLKWLNTIGIFTLKDIERIGPIRIFLKLKEKGYPVSLNLIYALIGALHNVHWTLIKETMKEEILTELKKAGYQTKTK